MSLSPNIQHASTLISAFFDNSDCLDYFVLRSVSHIAPNWEATWCDQTQRYQDEDQSFAADLNVVISLIANSPRPIRYHDNEDIIAEKTLAKLKWPIQKKGTQWIGADYASILEQGAFDDISQKDLVAAAAGRVHAAIDFGQLHFDQMDNRHQNMLSELMTIIIYHRYNDGTSFWNEAGVL